MPYPLVGALPGGEMRYSFRDASFFFLLESSHPSLWRANHRFTVATFESNPSDIVIILFSDCGYKKPLLVFKHL